jgi:hypothetical protein
MSKINEKDRRRIKEEKKENRGKGEESSEVKRIKSEERGAREKKR